MLRKTTKIVIVAATVIAGLSALALLESLPNWAQPQGGDLISPSLTIIFCIIAAAGFVVFDIRRAK
jgi:hypothetical protein